MQADDEERDRALLGYNVPLPFRFHTIADTLNAAGSLVIIALLVLINADVLGRNLFNNPVRGTAEITSLLIVGIVFIQLPSTIWAGRLTRAEIVPDLLTPGGRLRGVLFVCIHVAGAIALAIVAVSLYPALVRAWQIGDYIGSLGDFTAPYWPIRLVQLLGSACASIVFALLAINGIRQLVRQRDG